MLDNNLVVRSTTFVLDCKYKHTIIVKRIILQLGESADTSALIFSSAGLHACGRGKAADYPTYKTKEAHDCYSKHQQHIIQQSGEGR